MRLKMLLKHSLFFFLFFFQQISVRSQDTKRNYLFSQYKEKGKSSVFTNTDTWRANKKEKIRASLMALPLTVKTSLINRADNLIKKDWNVLKLTDYLEYVKSGRLEPYGNSSSQRHEKLTCLVIAELVDGKGKFLPEIANGLWLTLEESTWVLPEHIVLQKAGEGLPDPNETVIDLRSGDISTMVAWIRFLLYEELNKISPILIQRIDYELEKRIFTPYLSSNNMRWMGFSSQRVNNWNIWINTNILLSAILTLKDDKVRNEIIEKTILSSDNFLNRYPNDGGIDEGITYWKHAGGKLIQFVGLLTEFSNNALDWRKNQLIHNIGTYTYKAHIKNNQFVNFADASAISIPPSFYVYKYGELFDDATLLKFSSYLYNLEHPNGNDFLDKNFDAFLTNIETFNQIKAQKAVSPMLSENWLPDLQVLTLRENQGSLKGLFFGAKGGHNNESHNHNDVGNFVLYQNGRPAIIDVGVGTYTKQTFSKDRYKMWYMQSQWHNCPTINGVQQKNGAAYKAENVKYSVNKKEQIFSLDIGASYPKDAKVNSWQRDFIFTPQEGRLILKESYSLEEWIKPFEVHFITPMAIEKIGNGSIEIRTDYDAVTIQYNPLLFEVSIEDKPITDSKLSSVWGKQLKRITLTSLNKEKSGNHEITFISSK